MENLPLEFDWIFLVDADEALTPELVEEIKSAIRNPEYQRLLRFPADVLSGPPASPWRRGLLEAVSFRRGKGGTNAG